MRAFTTFAAAAAFSLTMAAGSANALTLVDIATSTSTGDNVVWTAATKSIDITNVLAELNFDNAIFGGSNLQSKLTLHGSSSDALEVTGSQFIQKGIGGTFDFKSLDGLTTYFSGTFSGYWINGFVGGNSGSLNNSGGAGTAMFTSSFVNLHGITDENFGISFQNAHPTFSIVGGNLQGFTGRAIVGTFGGAVPEPGTWGLMIMGFGGAGALLRSRRRALALGA